jgi:hypothetical protein
VLTTQESCFDIRQGQEFFFLHLKEFRVGLRPVLPLIQLVECSYIEIAHAQKPDFVFPQSPCNSAGVAIQSAAGRRAVHNSLQGLYCLCKPVFCSHVTLTGYPLHSPVSPSILLPRVTACHVILIGLYQDSFPRSYEYVEPYIRSSICLHGVHRDCTLHLTLYPRGVLM